MEMHEHQGWGYNNNPESENMAKKELFKFCGQVLEDHSEVFEEVMKQHNNRYNLRTTTEMLWGFAYWFYESRAFFEDDIYNIPVYELPLRYDIVEKLLNSKTYTRNRTRHSNLSFPRFSFIDTIMMPPSMLSQDLTPQYANKNIKFVTIAGLDYFHQIFETHFNSN